METRPISRVESDTAARGTSLDIHLCGQHRCQPHRILFAEHFGFPSYDGEITRRDRVESRDTFRPFAAGTQPPLDHHAYGSTHLRHPKRALRKLAQTISDTTGPHFTPALFPEIGDLTKQAKGEPLDPSEVRGMDQEEILNYFYGQVVFDHTPKGWARPFDPDAFRGVKLLEPLIDAATGEVVAEADAKLNARQVRKIAETTKEVLVGRADLLGRFVAEDLVNAQTGELYADAGEELVEAKLTTLEELGITRLPTLAIDQSNGPWIRNTLAVDKNNNRDDALIDVYRVMRPGEPPTAAVTSPVPRQG